LLLPELRAGLRRQPTGSSSHCVVERAGSRSTYPTKKIDEALDYDEGLWKDGHDSVSDALQPVRTAMTIRIRNDRGKGEYHKCSLCTDIPSIEARAWCRDCPKVGKGRELPKMRTADA
jgi:hypothetical protein